MSAPLLDVRNLVKYFPVNKGVFGRSNEHVIAVDDVSFSINEGKTVSIVGESGCGKSTTGRMILRLEEPTSGAVFFQGENLIDIAPLEMRKKRKDLQIIFQDPFSALNPRQTVRHILMEALNLQQQMLSKKQREARLIDLLDTVGLSINQADRYPHQFSGGQRQRIGIARALSVQPKLIVCDEAVSALDVSIQAQILNLLKKLQHDFGLTYVFISHDLAVVRYMSDQVIVMYLGKIVEKADVSSLFLQAQHPYTHALLSSIPVPDAHIKKDIPLLKGDIPSPINPPAGCRFHTRCPYATQTCREIEPLLRTTERMLVTHQAACHHLEIIPDQPKQNMIIRLHSQPTHKL